MRSRTLKPTYSVRRIVGLSAVLVALVLIAVIRPKSAKSAAIDIGNIRYQILGTEILATFSVTNIGGSALLTESFLEEDFVRIETEKGWQTVERFPISPSLSSFDQSTKMPEGVYPYLPVGGEIKMQVRLPPKTKRWQIGYKVTEARAQVNLELRFGEKWSRPIARIFNRWISREEKISLVSAPIAEIRR